MVLVWCHSANNSLVSESTWGTILLYIQGQGVRKAK